jgi:nucleotide-binding universal stress UspA family protein
MRFEKIMGNDYRILVATDLGSGTDRLLAEAQRYGRALNTIIDIIHVAPPDPDFVGYPKDHNPQEKTPSQNELIRTHQAKALRSEHRQVQAFEATLRANGVRVDRTLMIQGPITDTILEHVRKFNSDLLILGSHHHSALYRLWYGDVVIGAVKRAPCVLLVVPIE